MYKLIRWLDQQQICIQMDSIRKIWIRRKQISAGPITSLRNTHYYYLKGLVFYLPTFLTLIKTANTTPDRSAAFILKSVINWIHFRCTGICQIPLEIWPKLDLAGFLENGWIVDLLKPKSGTTLKTTNKSNIMSGSHQASWQRAGFNFSRTLSSVARCRSIDSGTGRNGRLPSRWSWRCSCGFRLFLLLLRSLLKLGLVFRLAPCFVWWWSGVVFIVWIIILVVAVI